MLELHRTHLCGQARVILLALHEPARRNPVGGVPVPTKAELLHNVNRVDRVKAILETKELTLHQVSQRSRDLYGASSRYFLPHNLYHDLRRGSFSPSLQQFCALSRISGYVLTDWLRVFGFAPERILEFQFTLSSKRTILLDASLDNCDSWTPCFRNATGDNPPSGIIPLGRLVEFWSHRRARPTTVSSGRNFLYVKIGSQDALAFPDLLPGSVVRVDPRLSLNSGLAKGGTNSGIIFLIEHSKGFWCSRVHVPEKNRIIPISSHVPCAHVEFRVPSEARLLGGVDMEIRRMHEFEEPDAPKEAGSPWKPERVDRRGEGLGSLLRRTRRQAALSFREASAKSRKIADLLGDEQYFASPGSLSDYEAQDDPPRHFHKVITLCSLYGIRFVDLLTATGIKAEELGKDVIPSGLIAELDRPQPEGDPVVSESVADDPTLIRLTVPFEELAPFLQRACELVTGMKELSLRDFFWTGMQSLPHPSLQGAQLLIVNRHKKTPARSLTFQQWRQPLYMLVRRDGTYLCAPCTLNDGMVAVHADTRNTHQPERLRNRHDVEVIGQIVTIVRDIP